MRHKTGTARLTGMQPPPYKQLTVEAVIDGSVIRGALTAPNGDHRDFHGWLEFHTALEAALMVGADHAPTAGSNASSRQPKSGPHHRFDRDTKGAIQR